MKGAVLIIGSLLWDNGNNRDIWRNDNLNINNKIPVFAPIRYGRKSEKSYTMVFSKELEDSNNLGTAFVVPFKEEINSFEELLNRVRSLSRVEGNKDDKLVKGNKQWCVFGILFKPNFDKIKKEEILAEYQQKLNNEGFSQCFTGFKLGKEKSIIKNNGEMDISWLKPKDIENKNTLENIDFVISACTKPQSDNDQYPTPEQIIALFNNDDRNYFHSNVQYGITTFQDEEVLRIKDIHG